MVAPVSSNTQLSPDLFQVENTLTEFVGYSVVEKLIFVPALGTVITSV